MAKETPKTNKTANWSRLRQVAAEEPKETSSALAEVAEAFGTMADSLTNLREHLDLIEAPKTASVRARIAAARKFGSSFRRMAEEAPEVVADAIAEVYQSSVDVVEAMESLANNMGIDLNPAEEPTTESESSEEEMGSEDSQSFTASKKKKAGPFMEKLTPEAALGGGALDKVRKFLYSLSNSDPEVHGLLSDPEVKNFLGKAAGKKKADGSAAFISDRDESAMPEAPEKLEIPQAEGESALDKAASKREALRQRIAARHGIEL